MIYNLDNKIAEIVYNFEKDLEIHRVKIEVEDIDGVITSQELIKPNKKKEK